MGSSISCLSNRNREEERGVINESNYPVSLPNEEIIKKIQSIYLPKDLISLIFQFTCNTLREYTTLQKISKQWLASSKLPQSYNNIMINTHNYSTNRINLLLGHFKNMKKITVCGCSKLENIIEKLSNHSSLNIIKLTGDDATDDNMKCLSLSKSLTIIMLTNNSNITDIGICHISKIKTLTKLELIHCLYLTNMSLIHIANTEIINLIIDNNRNITDFGIAKLAKNTTTLKNLELKNIINITKEGLLPIVTHCKLSYLKLYLSAPYIDDVIFALTSLTELCLSSTTLTDSGLLKLSTISNLNNLVLKYNLSITNDGLITLANMSNLQELHLEEICVDDNTLITLSKSKTIITLFINDTKRITKFGIKSLSNLITLKYLDLNNFYAIDAECSKELSSSKNLQRLRLHLYIEINEICKKYFNDKSITVINY